MNEILQHAWVERMRNVTGAKLKVEMGLMGGYDTV
jgi:hypothetical protein